MVNNHPVTLQNNTHRARSTDVMIDKFSAEVVDIILREIDPDYDNRARPAYTFTHKSRVLMPLTQVSRGWRNTILSMTGEYTSLVRAFESQKIDTTQRGLMKLKSNASTTIRLMSSSYHFVRELEVHSSINLSNVKHMTSIKALTILGDTKTQTRTDLPFPNLEYIAVSPSSSKLFTVPHQHKLKRLDLLINSDISFESISGLQGTNIEELNIMDKGSTSPLTMKPLVKFLSGLRRLNRLSLRKQTSKSSPGIPSEQCTTQELMDTVRLLPLRELSIDMAYLRSNTFAYFLSQIHRLQMGFFRAPLTVTLVEPSLAGQWTDEEETAVIGYMTYLSQSFDIVGIKSIYGLQTEIPTQTTTSSFVHLLARIVDERCTFLSNLTNFYTLMAWNILDDTQLFLRQQGDPYTYSYETNSTYSPNYRKCIKFRKLDQGPESVIIVRECEGVDRDFWSRETVLQHLYRYADLKPKSSLWD